MKQVFDLDLGHSRLFIKYFMAAMKEPGNPILLTNHSERFEEGYFLCEHDVTFKIDGENTFVKWLLKFNSDNTLCSVSNLNEEGDSEFELKLSTFLNGVLQNVLSQKRNDYFRRSIYSAFSGTNFMGEYWLQGIRFAQLNTEDTECHLVNAERLLVIDQKVKAIDDSNANEIADERASELISYLSFIMNIGIETPKREERFFLYRDNDGFSMHRASTQVISSEHSVEKMPRKGELCSAGLFQGSVFDSPEGSLIFPEETRAILKGIKAASEEYKDAFKRCCKLYQLALNVGRYYPTVRISYICAAVEAIVKTNVREYKSFSSFMAEYSGEDKELHDFIYSSVRSAHFHSGSFVLREFDFESPLMNPVASEISDKALNAESKMRFAIFNWLNEKIGFKEKREHVFKPIVVKRFGFSATKTIGAVDPE